MSEIIQGINVSNAGRVQPNPVNARAFGVGVLTRAMPGVVAGFSTALPPGTDQALSEQLRRLLEDRGVDVSLHPLLLAQFHSAVVLHTGALDGSDTGEFTPDGRSRLAGDGVHGRRGDGRVLVVKTADCVPLLVVHSGLGAHAALHAGWRGAAAGILPRLLEEWKRAGGDPSQVHLALGPHIRSCCYEVGPECVAAFASAHLTGAMTQPNGKPRLNLAQVLVNQAREAGVPEHQMDAGAPCTRCQVDARGEFPFASYRRDSAGGTRPVGRNISFIALLPQG